MKKCLFLVLLLLASPAYALNVSTPEWSGKNAVQIDGGYYPDYWSSVSPYQENYAAAVGWKDGGQAFQFTVSQPTHIDYLILDARANINNATEQEVYKWKFKLYDGSQVFHASVNPDGTPNIPAHEILASDIYLTGQSNTIKTDFGDLTQYSEKDYKDYVVPFNSDLKQGDYWVAAETHNWADGAATYSNLRFGSEKTVGTPEPSILPLFLFLIPLFQRRFRGLPN